MLWCAAGTMTASVRVRLPPRPPRRAPVPSQRQSPPIAAALRCTMRGSPLAPFLGFRPARKGADLARRCARSNHVKSRPFMRVGTSHPAVPRLPRPRLRFRPPPLCCRVFLLLPADTGEVLETAAGAGAAGGLVYLHYPAREFPRLPNALEPAPSQLPGSAPPPRFHRRRIARSFRAQPCDPATRSAPPCAFFRAQ